MQLLWCCFCYSADDITHLFAFELHFVPEIPHFSGPPFLFPLVFHAYFFPCGSHICFINGVPLFVSYNWTQLVGDTHKQRVEQPRIFWNCVLIRFAVFFSSRVCRFSFLPFLGNSLQVILIINKALDTQQRERPSKSHPSIKRGQ